MEPTADFFDACLPHSRAKYTNAARGFTLSFAGPAELNRVHSHHMHEPLDEPALNALRLALVT
jgi:hypothetical protein